MKPRNHIVLALIKRKAGSGAHRKSTKSQRQAARMALSKEIPHV
jgi:hypothetical protein